MTLDSAPVGTVVQVGHPLNKVSATKRSDGRWWCNITNRVLYLDPRDVRVMR